MRIEIPRLGMRIVKSALAVFICFLLYQFRKDGFPFYSAIAAILCMQQYIANSVKTAMNRTIGTLFGGFFGMLLLLFEQALSIPPEGMLHFFLVAVMIVPIIYTTVVLEKNPASYVSCVVFMSVAVSHGTDINPYLFTWNRIVDTLIGIFVSLAVNNVHIRIPKKKRLLFVSSWERGLLVPQGEVTAHLLYHLNTLIERNAKLTAITSLSPAEFQQSSNEVHWNLPVIVLNGAATYDLESKSFSHCWNIETQLVLRIVEEVVKQDLGCWIYCLTDDILNVYGVNCNGVADKQFYQAHKRLSGENYLLQALPDDLGPVVQMRVFAAKEKINTLREFLLEEETGFQIRSIVDTDSSEFSTVYIVSGNTWQQFGLLAIKEQCGATEVVGFGSLQQEEPMLMVCDKALVFDEIGTLKNAVSFKIQQGLDVVMGIRREFYH